MSSAMLDVLRSRADEAFENMNLSKSQKAVMEGAGTSSSSTQTGGLGDGMAPSVGEDDENVLSLLQSDKISILGRPPDTDKSAELDAAQWLRTRWTTASNSLLQQNLILGYLIAHLKRNLGGQK